MRNDAVPKRIIGIDPGYDRLGIAVIDKPSVGREVLVYSECFQTSSKDSIYERFGQIGGEVARVLEMYEPHRLAIETLFVTNNQKTAMRVSEARGIIIYEALRRGLAVEEYSPMEIKSAICDDGRSDKTRVAKMVHLLIDMPNRAPLDDEYDAIAVALTSSARLR